MIVPIAAPVPLNPLTVATDSVGYRSEGNTFAIVVNVPYANVANATSTVSTVKLTVNTVGISNVTPIPPNTTTAFRALPHGSSLA